MPRMFSSQEVYHSSIPWPSSSDAIAARITLIAPDGKILGDSDHDPATMDNHATRSEVVQALRQGTGESRRHSATLEKDLLYVAVPITREGATLGVARVALPVSEIQASANRLVAIVATALVAAAARGHPGFRRGAVHDQADPGAHRHGPADRRWRSESDDPRAGVG